MCVSTDFTVIHLHSSPWLLPSPFLDSRTHTHRTLHTQVYTLWPVSDPWVTFCGLSLVSGFDSRDRVAEMFIVRLTVKAPQKLHFFITQCNQRPNPSPNLLSTRVKLSLKGNYTIRNQQQSCCVLVSRLGVELSGWVKDSEVLSTASQGVQHTARVRVCVCVFVYACLFLTEFNHACAPHRCVFMWVCARRCAQWGGSGCVCLNEARSAMWDNLAGMSTPHPITSPHPFPGLHGNTPPHKTLYPQTVWMSGCLLKADGLFGK